MHLAYKINPQIYKLFTAGLILGFVIQMNTYKITLPENYNSEHVKLISDLKKVVQAMSSQTDYIFGVKDVSSRHIIATDSFAKIVGFKYGFEVSGKFESDMPCFDVSQYMEHTRKEDQYLLNNLNIKANLTTLKILHYSDGLKARMFKKHLLHHAESLSILGIIYAGYNIDYNEIIALLQICPIY